MAGEHADRLARLHHQCLIVTEDLQRRHEGVELFPVARGLRERCVDDEVFRTFTDLQDVLEHPQQPFLAPALAAEHGAARRRDVTFGRHARSGAVDTRQLCDRPCAMSRAADITLSINAGSRLSVNPPVGPATLTEAKICPLRVKTGAATALAPASSSS